MRGKKRFVPCPHCGEEIPDDASGCPHCGSDEKTGWSDGTYLDGIDLPDEDEYEAIRKKEFGGGGAHHKRSSRQIDWKVIIGGVILAAFIFGVVC